MIARINGTEVSGVQSAKTTDRAGGRGDDLEILLAADSGASAFSFGSGDTIELADGQYSTGIMRIDEMERMEESGRIAIRGTSMPDCAKNTGCSGYEYVTLEELMREGARALGLSYGLYGVNGSTQLRRIVRRNQTWPEFLEMVMRCEGATVKLCGGALLAIDYGWVFDQRPVRVLEDTGRGQLIERARTRMFRVRSGLCEGNAIDRAVTGSAHKQVYGDQIYSDMQAKRAALGYLLEYNMSAITYRVRIPLDTAIAAMSRIDLYGSAKTAGNWFVSCATHDFIREETEMVMKRCIRTIE